MSKSRFILVLSILLLGVVSLAQAQQIDLTSVYPLHAPDSIYAGVETTFEFSWNNTYPAYITSWTNVFEFWLDNYGPRSPVDIDSAHYVSQTLAAGVDGAQGVTRLSTDGIGVDTILLCASASSLDHGMPAGWNEVMAIFTVTIDPINIGAQFCIDSSWCAPA
jgi:hypothetical protein